MNKTLIIIKREFFSRTRKKTFLLTTILLPLLLFGFYAAMIYFSVKGESSKKIAILDEPNLFEGKIEGSSNVNFVFVSGKNPEAYKKDFSKEGYDAYLHIPANLDLKNPSNIAVYGKEQVGIGTQERMESRINKAIERKQMQAFLGSGISVDELNKIKSDVDIRSISLKDGEEKEGNAKAASIAAFVMGFLVYFVLMIYGSMVMRGVMEEKTNRIAEVMVSSVKPFQLMMGKIIGIGAVGLVQFLIWLVLLGVLQLLLPVIFPGALEQMASNAPAGMAAGKASGFSLTNIGGLNIIAMAGYFIFYFLGGYFLYSSLFAAVGSSVNEDPQDAQQLMLPIMMPIIFSLVILTKVIQDPHSGLAIFGSMFPLTSPIVMMGRLPFDVPMWQILLSLALLVGGFLGTTWLAGKIYRTGILMYGKKVTWKEMMKWVFR